LRRNSGKLSVMGFCPPVNHRGNARSAQRQADRRLWPCERHFRGRAGEPGPFLVLVVEGLQVGRCLVVPGIVEAFRGGIGCRCVREPGVFRRTEQGFGCFTMNLRLRRIEPERALLTSSVVADKALPRGAFVSGSIAKKQVFEAGEPGSKLKNRLLACLSLAIHDRRTATSPV